MIVSYFFSLLKTIECPVALSKLFTAWVQVNRVHLNGLNHFVLSLPNQKYASYFYMHKCIVILQQQPFEDTIATYRASIYWITHKK